MTAVIIEDERLVAEELVSKICQVANDITILETLSNLESAKKWFLQNDEPDILFMDIQLSDGVSFELFEEVKLKCLVIFTTAYDEYAIRAFKVNGIDYLLKPIEDEDLKKAIDKSRKLIQQSSKIPFNIAQLISNFAKAQTTFYKERFIVHFRNNWIPVDTKEIAFFVKENSIYLYTFSGDKYILDFAKLEDIVELLDPKIFYKANRQSIIHMDSILSVKLQENQKLKVILKEPLKSEIDISREKAPAFKKWFDR